jgi:DNA-binding beta-propeller fold protein YncE
MCPFNHSNELSFGVPMSFRRVGRLAMLALATLICLSCGQVYRPVVIPVNTVPPNPANFHAVYGIATNVLGNPGTAMQFDVSGDTDIGAEKTGVTPTHAAILPNNSRVFVANAGSLVPGEGDIITSFTPASSGTIASGLGAPVVFTLPTAGAGSSSSISAITEVGGLVTVAVSSPLSNAVLNASITIEGVNPTGYNGSFPIANINGNLIQYVDPTTGLAQGSGGTATVPVICQYLPDYVTTSQNNAVYVANFGAENNPNCNLASTDSVALLNPATNGVTNISYLGAGTHPVAMAETQDGLNLYVVNQGNNTVDDLSPVDLTSLCPGGAPPCPIAVPGTPTWIVARADSHRIYVLTQGSGLLVPIDTATNTILPSQTNLSVGAGANFILYDPNLNRLYVTNPVTGNVFVFADTGGVNLAGQANDTPTLLATISMTQGTNPACQSTAHAPVSCAPVGVAALRDGSRFYVASYEREASCPPDANSTSPCVIPRMTVFNALTYAVIPPASGASLLPQSFSLLTLPFAATQYAVPELANCVPVATYTPGATRFRMFAAASEDGSRVYASTCDGGSVAIIQTTTSTTSTGQNNAEDFLVTDLLAPFSATPVTSGEPPPQSPVFLLTGQ